MKEQVKLLETVRLSIILATKEAEQQPPEPASPSPVRRRRRCITFEEPEPREVPPTYPASDRPASAPAGSDAILLRGSRRVPALSLSGADLPGREPAQ